MDLQTETGFLDLNGTFMDLVYLYEKRVSGPTIRTHSISQTYDKDLGSIFYLNANLGGFGLSAIEGKNCGYQMISGRDIGSLFCNKGTLVPIDPNLVYHYKFNSWDIENNKLANYASGSAVYDAIISNGTGEVKPTIDTVSKNFGTGSMSFPGGDSGATTGGYIKLPSFTNDLNGLSFCCWVKATDVDNTSSTRIFDFSTNTATTNDNSVNGIALFTQDGVFIKGSGADVAVLPTDLTGSSFKFVVITVQCLNTTTLAGEVKLYVNGILSGTNSNYNYPSVMTRTFNLLGMGTFSTGSPFKGNMDDFRLYKRILNTNEITNLYTTNTTGPMGLMPYLPAGSVALYACKWVNNNYIGPIFKIRRVGDGALQDFYMDSTGVNVGIGVNGTGMSLATWIAAAGANQTAYVHTWYDQSGAGKHAIQTVNGLQPFYSQTMRNIYIADGDTSFVIDSNGVSLFSAGNIPFTVSYKTGLASELKDFAANTYIECNIFSCGGNGSAQGDQIYLTSTRNYIQTSFYEDNGDVLQYPRSATNNEIVTQSYNTVKRFIHLNGNLVASKNVSVPLNLKTGNFTQSLIGSGVSWKFTGSLEYFYINNTALSDSNRLLMESVGKASVIPTTGLAFALTFGSSTFPTTDLIAGSTLTKITNASYSTTPAIVLDETRGYVLATDVGTGVITDFIPNTASFSRCFWLKRNSSATGGNTISSTNYPVYFPTGTKIQIDLNVSNTTVVDTTDRGLVWVHYVFTYDSTSKTCMLYVNGDAVSKGTTGTIPAETNPLCIGNNNTGTKLFGGNQYFDDIYCYSRALTITEVISIYNNGKA